MTVFITPESAEQDLLCPGNSSVHHFRVSVGTKSLGPGSRRCIGWNSKPDLATPGTEETGQDVKLDKEARGDLRGECSRAHTEPLEL